MPLAGTICCQDGKPSTFDRCLCAARQRECVYPLPLIMAMSNNGTKRIGAGLSATTINQCPLQTVLKEENEFFESPAAYHARWLGEGMHALMTMSGEIDGVIQERRIRKCVHLHGQSVEITGQPDWYDQRLAHLDDWKYTKSCPSEPYDDHVRQLNIYAWLIDGGVWDGSEEESTDVVDTASITYIDKMRCVTHNVPLWTTEAVESMIVRRIDEYVRYTAGGGLPNGIDVNSQDFWKTNFCPFRGTGKCCGDREVER